MKLNIAVAIEKNRIALLRIVFCWLVAADYIHRQSYRAISKPLPKRVGKWVLQLLAKAEKACANLLIAQFYQSQTHKQRDYAFEKYASMIAGQSARRSSDCVTLKSVIERLKKLQHLLINLHLVARQLAKVFAARAFLYLMQFATRASAPMDCIKSCGYQLRIKNPIPP